MEIIDIHTKKTFNIMNVHLESLYTTSRNISSFPGGNSFSSVIRTIWSTGKYGSIFELLNKNAQAQEKQLNEIKSVLAQLKDPTIIAGDFNSPPEQWHHRNLRVGYTDAHREAGWGFGATVERLGILHSRVDYLYASKELGWSGQTTVNNEIHCSDHFPIQSKFDLYQ
jgi:endonuclease/exonuclease/phosphatase family metal-dependent hydrolase